MKAALRIGLAVVALAGAAVALAVAHDVSAYDDTFAAGDAGSRVDPASAVDWMPSTIVPGDRPDACSTWAAPPTCAARCARS